MINFNKSVELTISIDPFTYIALEKAGKPEKIAQDIIINHPTIHRLSEDLFEHYIWKDEYYKSVDK